MLRSLLIAFLLYFHFNSGAQTLVDSLSYDKIYNSCLEKNNCYVRYSKTDSIWRIIVSKSDVKNEDYEKKKIKSLFDGDYYEYDAQKRLRIVGNYLNGKEEALFLFINPEGKIQRSTHFHKGKLNGPAKTYYSNGYLRLLQEYKKGKMNGDILGYYQDGTQLFTGKYKKDKMIGQRMYFDVKGRPANGEMTWRHENGAVKLTGKCINGLPEGRFTHFDEKGEIILVVNYSRGLPDGAYIKYKNGLQEFKDCYVLGRYSGKNCP